VNQENVGTGTLDLVVDFGIAAAQVHAESVPLTGDKAVGSRPRVT